MSLENIYKHIKQAEEELAMLVERQKQEQTGKPMMYVFVYEQKFKDEEGWGPNQQHIEATTLEGAFKTLGYVIEKMELTVRNIRYGRWSEMQDELEVISEYWRKEHDKRKNGSQ